jgi:hypothetical protein
MATLYLVCGGPAKDVIGGIFGREFQSAGTATGLFSRCNSGDGQIGFVCIDDHWVFSGDADQIFRYHEPIAIALSRDGEAVALFGQTTAAYYEIVRYKNGEEVARTLDLYTDAGERTQFSRKRLEMDDLWDVADRLLPEPTDKMFDRPVKWIETGM